MSLKRYAIFAAVSQQQQQQQQLHNNATIMSATTTATTIAAATTQSGSSSSISSSTSSSSEDEEQEDQEQFLHSQELGKPIYYNQQRAIAGGGISLVNGAASGNSNSNHNGLATAAGAGGGSGTQTYTHVVVNGSVNLLLGGSMLCLVTTILCVVCYCCHRNIKKRTEAAYRQQQHQWLENDPNMEIYSVEQCYETSGLFLGDSTDGLAALPALHHEPPPSYDAVVLHEQQLLQQQQEQLEAQQLQLQQQQLLLQRISPPPGYRSTLDISSVQQVNAAAAAAAAASSVNSLDALAAGSSSGSSCGGIGIVVGNSNAVGGSSAALVNKQLQRALNAQSCCSLQRAEVENMWNAAAAAVSARNGHFQELETYMGLPSPPPPPPLPLALQARKHAQAAMRLNSFGRRYLQQSQQHQQHHSHYRRGCPLCGKFRYAVEEGEMTAALTASVESGLEQSDANENVANDEQEMEQQEQLQQQQLEQEQHQQQQEEPQQSSTCNQIENDVDADAANGNVMDNINEMAAAVATAAATTAVATTAAATTAAATAADIDENDNATAPAPETGNVVAAAATNSNGNNANQSMDINNINENGIISLDMSKIIDISGLPTYEGALKLESSGYV